ncbi:MAG: NADH-quinone oxidoreductase subunit L, partial [Alphaproteobacteria bacterium]
MESFAQLILFLPAVAAVLVGLFQAQIGDRGAQLITTGAVSTSAVLSIIVFINQLSGGDPFVLGLLPWIQTGGFEVSWAIKVDMLTAVMLCVVTIVSAIVHVYSIGYMAEDEGRARFQAYLSLFTFAMLMLVTADNLVQLFFGWEGVGVASYLLIGFWFHKESANQAAMKAFIVNRVGDFGFALGIFGIFWMTGSIYFDEIFTAFETDRVEQLFGWSAGASLTVVTMLLFVGAMGKSAQFFLHTWLPDAMEGPTPVSALIHAATMVTAGVFLVARMSPVFQGAEFTMAFITIIGATTALFAATVGLTQFDIKRVIAYSTCSQLGYMFFALGLGLVGPAVFHLATHAFFKAL